MKPRMLFLALLCSCSPSLKTSGVAITLRNPGQAAYPESPAVYLLRDERVLLVSRWRSPSYSQMHYRNVLAILNEEGVDYADVRVPYEGKSQIVEFAAKTILPDGTVQEVDPSRVFDDVAREGEDDDANVKIRVFSLPRVSPGTIIDYAYTIESPELETRLSGYISSEIPVERFELTLEGTQDIKYAVKAYNTRESWRTEDRGDTWQLRFSMSSIPASEAEKPYAPSAWNTAPRWLFRVSQYAKYRVVVDIEKDWSSALRWRANALVLENDEYYEGFSPDFVPGPTPKDSLEKALRFLQDFVRRDGSWPGEKAKNVLADKRASGVEKARILWFLLKKAGVEAKFAFTQRRYYLADFDAPTSNGLPVLVLYLPTQPGVDAPTWIDPSCDYCELGEIPVSLEGSEAMVIDQIAKAFGSSRPEAQVARRPIVGKKATPELERVASQVQINAVGDARVQLTLQAFGRNAQDARANRSPWNDREWQDFAEEVQSQRGLGRPQKWTWDLGARQTSLVVTSTVPAYAIRHGDQMFVPLSHLHSSWEEPIPDGPRTVGVHFFHPYSVEEVSLISVPSGFAVAKMPGPVDLNTPYFTASFRAVQKSDTAVEVSRVLHVNPSSHDVAKVPAIKAALAQYAAMARSLVAFRRK